MRAATPSPFRIRRIDLLAVLAILGLLALMTPPLVSKARASANLRACQSNLRQIAGEMQLWADDRNHGDWPAERGIQFLWLLIRDGNMDRRDAGLFRCPATGDSYAVRDGVRFPLDKRKLAEEPIASDGNHGRADHPRFTNVVYADGHIAAIDLKDYAKQLPADAEWVPVGPDSPDADLRKLAIE
jgi:prepilin-type processing-associated H-X9-DG protein